MTCKISELIAPHFFDVHRDVRAHGHTHYWLDGGRGSTKSSFVSLEIPLLLLRHPDAHAVVMRKVGNTLRNSVYAANALGAFHDGNPRGIQSDRFPDGDYIL